MKAKYILVLSILVVSLLSCIQVGCSTENSPTEPADPAVESASQVGEGAPDPVQVSGPGVDIE